MGLFTKIKNAPVLSVLKQNTAVRRSYLWVRYGMLQKPFCSPQMEVAIDEEVRFNLDYTFGLHRYDEFGNRHNAGFKDWLKECSGKRIVFDIGAHIGLYAIPASRVIASGGKIYAFEPAVANLKFFRKHLEYNHCANVVVEDALVGEVSRPEVDFAEHPDSDAMNAIVVQKNAHLYTTVQRRQVALDDFCYQRQVFPQVMKIDVEGAEVRVLKGAQRLLREKHPVIFLSIHPSRIRLLGDTLEEMLALAAKAGYTLRGFDGNVPSEIKFGEYKLV